jgi:hypothetical protein
MISPNDDQAAGALTTGRTAIGLFRDRSHAENAIRALRQAGFREDQIGMAMPESASARAPKVDAAEEVAEGATVGALTGGVVGGLVGLLGSLLIPGVGPILLGGVMATLWGAGIGVATGGFMGALVSMGVPESDAAHFDAGLREGGLLVTVTTRTGVREALSILQRHEADLGPSGGERRTGLDRGYSGPERRLAGV